MATNLRSRPIEGYITDNAGNVLRNTDVIIKEDSPSASYLVDTARSDDDGYFITKPIKNGLYDVYESGIRIYRIYHSTQPTSLQCYAPGVNNIPTGLPQFADYVNAAIPTLDINNFRTYIQIEPETLDIPLYGHQFPIWNIDPTVDLVGHPFEHLNAIHPEITTSNESKLTHTRFDIEFFLPLFSQNPVHRRIRWAGVPGIMIYKDAKLVLPLDYYSMIPNHVSAYTNTNITWNVYNADNSLIEINGVSNTFYDAVSVGNILEVKFTSVTPVYRAWFILYYKASTGSKLYGRLWKSANTSHTIQGITDLSDIVYTAGNVTKITSYQGVFSGIQNITQSTSEYFTVTENNYAQDQVTRYNSVGSEILNSELYDYNKAV
jgi:hypothetical protein